MVLVSQRDELVITVKHVDFQTFLDGIEHQDLRGEFHVLKSPQSIWTFPGSLFVLLGQGSGPSRFVLSRFQCLDHLARHCFLRILECFDFFFDDCADFLFCIDRFQHLQHTFQDG